VACFGPCTSSGASSGTTWGDDLYLKETGDWSADDRADAGASLLIATPCASLQDAFDKLSGTTVQVPGQVVTAGSESFSDRLYVESTDRTRGALVQLIEGTLPAMGAIVTVTGTLGLFEGEAALVSAHVKDSGTPPEPPRPLGSYSRWMQSPWPLSRAVLVRAWGKVTYVGSGWFVLDDGSGVDDGEGHSGIKIRYDGTVTAIDPPSTEDHLVAVTGITARDTDGTRTVLRLRGPDDVERW